MPCGAEQVPWVPSFDEHTSLVAQPFPFVPRQPATQSFVASSQTRALVVVPQSTSVLHFAEHEPSGAQYGFPERPAQSAPVVHFAHVPSPLQKGLPAVGQASTAPPSGPASGASPLLWSTLQVLHVPPAEQTGFAAVLHVVVALHSLHAPPVQAGSCGPTHA